MQLHIPKWDSNLDLEVNPWESIVFLWANWSWKTRLWAWIDLKWPQNNLVHRISAQKSLQFPTTISGIKAVENAEKDLRYWSESTASWANYKIWHKRWSKPSTHLLNDYLKLLNLLFSEYINKISDLHEWRTSVASETKLHIVKRIWENVLPHRELVISWNTIHTKKLTDTNTYSPSEMSDWERVIFYMIWQCLCAPENSIIIIDEPELHLNKSILNKLRDEIEKERSDCVFLYFTHDLDFSKNHHQSKKIWIKKYDWSQRDREFYNDLEWVPDQLQYEIIWSRERTLFIEWDESSFDIELYKEVFPNTLIKACWSCNNVIRYTRAFKDNPQFSDRDFYGLIDRDRRKESEIESLKENWVYVLEVAEIENIFLIPELIKVLCAARSYNYDEKIEEIVCEIISFLQSELDHQIALRVENELKYRLSRIAYRNRWTIAILNSYNAWIQWIDVPSIIIDESNILNWIIDEKNYQNMLKVYNRKSLSNRIASILGLQSWELQATILRKIKLDGVWDQIIDWICNYIPEELKTHLLIEHT